MIHHTLISTEALAANLSDPDLVVFDCRHDLMDVASGRKAYAAGHIPGARFAHLDENLSGPKTGRSGRHPLPAATPFASWLGQQGVDERKQVVAYDASGGYYAARLWWMLRWLGHDDTAVLDGGMRRWIQLGLPTRDEVPAPARGDFVARPRPGLAASADEVLLAGRDPAARVLDARAPERYRGEVEPIDKVAGHVPGARNHPFGLSLDAQGRFLSRAVLREALTASLDGVAPERAIAMCGSGVTACHLLLALEHAGLGGGRLYAGSWSEWSSDPARPVSTGAAP
jgi:thiosulfate/3-mercaptopyruvate sulfurtransferase